MSDGEVLAALNVLKRYGQIESVLFYEGQSYLKVYLPAVEMIMVVGDGISLWSSDSSTYISSFRLGEAKRNELMKQWKLAKLAVAFL